MNEDELELECIKTRALHYASKNLAVGFSTIHPHVPKEVRHGEAKKSLFNFIAQRDGADIKEKKQERGFRNDGIPDYDLPIETKISLYSFNEEELLQLFKDVLSG